MGMSHSEESEKSFPFVVRPMRKEDIPSVMEIERRSFPSPWPESAYRYEIRHRRSSQFYVLRFAEEKPKVGWQERLFGTPREEGSRPLLGYMGLRFRSDHAHVSTIAIHPDWRGRGLGKFLLLALLEIGLQHGIRRFTLEVRPSNRVARQLYAQVGFTRTGIRPTYYRNGEDALLMALGPLDKAGVTRLRQLRVEIEDQMTQEFGKEKVEQ